jgi:cytosine/adenosine deaminase-related metal-dependent hydrolase
MPPQARARLAADAAERKSFAKDLREMLALAEEARAAGRAAQPGVKLQDVAREAVEREKRERVIAEIASRRRVTVAEDFQAEPVRPATPRP